METNKIQALAQFNKLNGMFTMILGMVDDLSMLNHDLYNYVEVLIDPDMETIEGTFTNFQIVDTRNLPIEITEDSLNALARDKILATYPMESQLSILGSVLEKLADANGIECNDLKEMNDFILEVRRVNGIRKEFYASNPEYRYRSTEELDEYIRQKYEGGILENAGLPGNL